jgi:hypothetical protein
MTTEPSSTGTIIIRHRINTIEQLEQVPPHQGIEFDIREGPTGIMVTHDPWTPGIPFEAFVARIRHAFCIVNVKCEGIEYEALRLLKNAGVESFFLLDCSFPMIVKLSRMGERRIAVRVSEYEATATAASLCGKVDWIWFDSFACLPTPQLCDNLRAAGFRVCLVSPELQGRTEDATHLRPHVDAVCTKLLR